MTNFREFLEKNTIFNEHPVPNSVKKKERDTGDQNQINLFNINIDQEGFKIIEFINRASYTS